MKFFDLVSDALSWSLVNAGRTRARLDLLKRGERFLADNGFSRELLEQGNAAWPWQIGDDEPSITARSATHRARPSAPASVTELHPNYAQAEAELEAMSDTELWDLGIARTDIATAVRNGRPGVDESVPGTSERMAA